MTTLVCPLCRIALTPPEHLCPRDGREGVEHAFHPVPAALTERFRVVMPFAGSSNASLYVVDALGSGRRGVLKLLQKPQNARDQEQLRMRRELEKQRTLDCPYLVVPWEHGETGGVTWIFRRWLDGVSLRAKLAREPALPQREALAIAAQITVALEALHAQGLLHRDVHPGHVFLEARAGMPARVQLIDAGVPFVRHRTDGPPQVGTPGYSAPEQLLGKLVSMRSDLYSVGVLLAEILQGHRLFEGDSADALLDAQLRAGRPTMSDTLAESVRAMVDALLSTDPQRRPFSAQKLRRTLDAYLLEGAPMTRQPTSSFSTSRPNSATAPSAASGNTAPSPAHGDTASAGAVPAAEAPAAPVGPRPSYEPAPARPAQAAPPPPPAAALRTARPPMQPTGRPSSRAPLPPPPTRKREPDMTQQLDDALLQELAPKAAPPALPARHQPVSARPQRTNEDYTVPVRLDQILAVSQTPPRASAIPPPAPSPLAPELAATHLEVEPPKAVAPVAAALPLPTAPAAHLGTLFDPESMTEAARAAEAGSVPLTATVAVGVASIAEVEAAVSPAAPATKGEPAESPTGDFGPVKAHKPTSLGMPNPIALANAQAVLPRLPPMPRPAPAMAGAEARVADVREKLDLSHEVTTLLPARAESQPPARAAVEAPAGAPPAGAPPNYAFESAVADPVAATLSDAAPGGAYAGGAEPVLAPDEITQPVRELQSSIRPPTDDEQRRKLIMYASAAAAALLIGFGGRALFGDTVPDEAMSAAGQAQLAGSAPEAAPTAAAPARVEPAREMPKLADIEAHDEPSVAMATSRAQQAPRPTTSPIVAQAAVETARAPTVSPVIPAVVIAAKDAPPPKDAPVGTRSKESRADEPRRERAEKAPRAEKAARGDKSSETSAAKWAQARDEARAFYAERQYQKAADAYERATRFDPQNPGTYAGLGAARLQLNNARGAVEAYGKAVQLSPNTAGFHAALGRAYAAANDPTRAKASYKRALALDPQNQNIAAALKALD